MEIEVVPKCWYYAAYLPRRVKTSAVYLVVQNADGGARLVTGNYGAENPRGKRLLKGAVIPVGTLIREKSRGNPGRQSVRSGHAGEPL